MFIRDPAIVPLFLASCTSFFTCFFTSCSPPSGLSEPDPPLRVFFIDVGQGDACLLRTPEGKHFLYDIGNREDKLARFLSLVSIDTLEAVLISHADLDHFGAFAGLRNIPVKKWYLPETRSPDPAWLRLMAELDARQAVLDTLHAGDTLALGPRMDARVLWPPRYFSAQDNDLSQVIRITFGAGGVLLTGDLEAVAETALLGLGAELSSPLLKVAHHGSRTSSTLPLLAAIQPRWAVISCDSAVYGHPHPETLAGLRRFIPEAGRILRTDREGTLVFEVDEEGVRRVAEKEVRMKNEE